ncbi:tetratricopeptide repeat protein [Pseudoruegeria sp. SHC-113]|uniref:tetratricopeptide repeat protein n=1 Tax=Pseudoruegeria sp. SHC-113 TaxID=2855439 RepID=UPI0021BAC26F|nr:tetratricopeptide repeat protein [Pseudoruegeria sp. SHC-113]MCT8162203.1 tetratricopeptide repeat protein [Pseudoruegeria sp. SHC-113]
MAAATLEPDVDPATRRGLCLALRGAEFPDLSAQLRKFPTEQATQERQVNLSEIRRPLSLAAKALLGSSDDTPLVSMTWRGIAKALNALRVHGLAQKLYRALLARQPDDLLVAGELADLLIERGQFRRAERVLTRAEALGPTAPDFAERRLRLQVMTGESFSAAAKLDELIATGQASPGLLCLRITAELNLGQARRALKMAQGWRKKYPDHKGLLLKKIDAEIACKAFERAHDSLRLAFATFGSETSLTLQEARLKRAEGDFGAALALVQRLKEGSTDPRVNMELGRVYSALGRSDDAALAFRSVLERDRMHRPATIAMVELSIASEGRDYSEARFKQTLSDFPDDVELQAKYASGLTRAGREKEAEHTCRKLRKHVPEHIGVGAELARLLLIRGAPRRARQVLYDLLNMAPENPALLLLNTEVLLELEGPKTAEKWLSDRIEIAEQNLAEAHAPKAGPDPRALLQLAELNLQTGHSDRAAAYLDCASRQGVPGDTAFWLRALQAGLSLRNEEIAALALKQVFSMPTLRSGPALAVLEAVRTTTYDQTARSLAAQLATQVLAADRARFDIGVAFRLEGPVAALKTAKQCLPIVSAWNDALLKARLLHAAGTRILGVRYLQRAIQVWPEVLALRLLCAEMCMEIGRYDAAQDALSGISQSLGDERVAAATARMLAETGQFDQALSTVEKVARSACTRATAELGLRISLTMGDLPAAERFSDRLKTIPTGQRSYHAHFQSSMLGAQLNELRILNRVPEEADPTSFFLPAKSVVAQWRPDRDTADQTGEPIPHRIWQYWDARVVPPMIGSLMEDWRESGFAYRRFDLHSALSFLSEGFGKDFVKAFRLTSHKAEAADFFRLCLLLKEGGVYIDADDRRIGDLEAFLADKRGCVLFREPWGALANNVIITSPDHPVMATAVGMALRSLLAREHDNTWAKTGPGLLTRAAASAIGARREDVEAAVLQILPQSVLAPVVGTHLALPYKATSAYWNWSGAHRLPPAVEQVIQTAAG